MSSVTIRGELANVNAFIDYHFKKYNIKLSAGSVVRGNALEACPASVILHYDEMYKAVYAEMWRNDPANKPKLPKFTSEQLKYALEMYMHRKPVEIREEVVTSVRHNPSLNFTELDKWILAVTGQKSELYAGIMKHFIWQVKRKMTGQKVVHHLCPLLFSIQGSGKSTAVTSLLEPIKDMAIKHQPKETTDVRNAASLNSHYVVFWDEMPLMDKVDLPSLKDVISTDYVTYRPLFTNSTRKVEQNCTFIGASNNSAADNIKDSTGSRRFGEIICADMSDRELVNSINYLELWQSVDENLERGYYTNIEQELKEQQDLATELDEAGHFAADTSLLPVVGVRTLFVPAKQLYEAYRAWNPDYYGSKLFYSTFFRKMANLKLKKCKHNDIRGYYINSESSIVKIQELQIINVPANFKRS